MAFERIDAITLNSGEDLLYSSAIDATSGYAFFGTNTIPGKIVRIRLSDFTRVDAITLASGENYLVTASQLDNYAYFVTNTSPIKVKKLNMLTFTIDNSLTLASTYSALSSIIVGNNLYIGDSGFPGKIFKISLATFTYTATYTLPDYYSAVPSLSTDGTYLYAADYPGSTYSITGKIRKIALLSFTLHSTLTFPTGQRSLWLYSQAINNYLYSQSTGTVNGLVKIDLSTFTISSTMTSTGKPDTGVYYEVNSDCLCISNGASPAQVFIINLEDFTQYATLTLNTGENNPKTSVIDGANLTAYFGTYTSPGKVVKIGLTWLPFGPCLACASDSLTIGGVAETITPPSETFKNFGSESGKSSLRNI